MNRSTILLLSSSLSASFLIIMTVVAPLKYSFETSSNTTSTSSLNNTTPKIFFPTENQVKAVFEQGNYHNKPVSNMTNATVTNLKEATDRNNTLYVVWQEGDNIWLAIGHREGGYGNNSNGDHHPHPNVNFTQPMEIAPPNSMNVTNLQIATDDSETAVVWKAYNQTTSKNNIFGALTQDGGATWNVHIISNENANSDNPLLVNPKVVFYLGENEQACENPYGASSGSANQTSSSGTALTHGLHIVCFHPW